MSSGSTYSDKECVTSLHLDDSVNLAHMNNSVSEQHKVHGNLFRQSVICLKLLVEYVSQLWEVFDLNVNLCALIKEVHEYCVFAVGGAVLIIVDSECRCQLLVDKGFE